MTQQTQQVDTIFTKWLEQSAAKGVVIVDSQDNLNILVAYIRNKCGSVVTPANLDKALNDCWNVLAFEEGKAPTNPNDKLQKKIQSMKKQEAGFIPKNIKTEFDKVETRQSTAHDEVRKKAVEARTKQAQAEIDRIIETHLVVSVGRVNHGKTEEQREQLRRICVKQSNGEIDWNATLEAVEVKARQFAGL